MIAIPTQIASKPRRTINRPSKYGATVEAIRQAPRLPDGRVCVQSLSTRLGISPVTVDRYHRRAAKSGADLPKLTFRQPDKPIEVMEAKAPAEPEPDGMAWGRLAPMTWRPWNTPEDREDYPAKDASAYCKLEFDAAVNRGSWGTTTDEEGEDE